MLTTLKNAVDDSVWQMCSLEITEAHGVSLRPFTSSYSCPHWILDALFVPSSAIVLLALSSNAVQVLSFSMDSEEGTQCSSLVEQCRFMCEIRTLLFSATLRCQPSHGDCERRSFSEVDQERQLEPNRYSITVAGGTAFGETVVWKLMLDLESLSSMDCIAPAFCLQGHAGAVLRSHLLGEVPAMTSASG